VRVNLVQGVFSKLQFSLMTNSELITNNGKDMVMLSTRKEYESDEKGAIWTGRVLREPIFIYDKQTGQKITDWTYNAQTIYINQQFKEVIVDYWYEYYNGCTKFTVGQPLTYGYLSLTGKMRVKDDTTGKVVTGIIRIPKLRLMSDLSIRMGSDAIPQVGRLDAVAVPEGVRGQ
jgi:hypothetical protein